jgi:hypothetical protein
MALPAGRVIDRLGDPGGIVGGFAVAGVAALLFVLALSVWSWGRGGHEARDVRVRAKHDGTIPGWNLVAGHEGFIFGDVIEIE